MTNTSTSWPFQQVELSYDQTDVGLTELWVGFEIQLSPTENANRTDRGSAEITAYELGIWLRHATSKVVHIGGQPTCRLSTPPAIEIGSPLVKDGVHEPGSCTDGEAGCVIHDAFGRGLNTNGQITGHGTHEPTQTSLWPETNSTVREASATSATDSPETLTILWRLTMNEDLAMLGLLTEGINYLDSHASEYRVRLGSASTVNAVVRRAQLMNPLYTSLERLHALDPQPPTAAMRRKDEEWKHILRPAGVEALQERLSGPEGLDSAIRSGTEETEARTQPTEASRTEHRQPGDWAMSFWG